jgi:hypothetical protein
MTRPDAMILATSLYPHRQASIETIVAIKGDVGRPAERLADGQSWPAAIDLTPGRSLEHSSFTFEVVSTRVPTSS